MIEAHIASHPGSDPIESIVRLIVTMLGTSIAEREVRATRLELVLRHPQLMGRQFAQMTRMAERLSNAVTAILDRDERFAGADAPTAELMLAICGAAVRVAVMELAAAHSEPDTEQLQQRAIVLVREVVQKLQ